MKRHTALAPLSREHHGALILAQLLKKGAPIYKGLPTELNEKATYASNFYHSELSKHFNYEEQFVINLIKGIHPDLDNMSNKIIDEHIELRKLFESIKAADNLAIHLDELGQRLEQHIRNEERFFFPMIQENCSEIKLAEIEKALSV